jgi:hypothetical protein
MLTLADLQREAAATGFRAEALEKVFACSRCSTGSAAIRL